MIVAREGGRVVMEGQEGRVGRQHEKRLEGSWSRRRAPVDVARREVAYSSANDPLKRGDPIKTKPFSQLKSYGGMGGGLGERMKRREGGRRDEPHFFASGRLVGYSDASARIIQASDKI